MMAEKEQVITAMKNRIKGMKIEAELRDRPGLKQKVEELDFLVEMLERCLGQNS